MKFKEVKRVSVTDEIIEQLKNLIMDGTLKPGEKLPSEIKIAAQMGVGRGTVREALKILIFLGVIERQKKTSYISLDVINRLSHKDIFENFKHYRDVMEMIEVRKIIEPEAAGYAATRSNEREIEEIQKQYLSMTSSQNNLEDFINYDNLFHLHIIRATRNHILVDIMNHIQRLLKRNQALILRKSNNIMPRSLKYHESIYNSIKDGQPKLAKKHMLNHIIDIEKEMYKILKEEET